MIREELLELLCRLFPPFRPYWEADDNCFRDADDFTVHGIYACFSHYFSAAYDEHNVAALSQLFASIESAIICDHKNCDGSANAATTCFLENIAGTTPGERARIFMGAESRRYFDSWNNQGVHSNA